MSSPTAVVCREVFDENSQPSAEEICEYAQQLGIDPESESHLLPLARDGLMQALPAPWKAYFDEKIQTHYYYNEDTKRTQWEHPLDNVYRDLVKKARDVSMHDDTCASVQELPTSEENTKNLERVETKVESDEELHTDSDNHASDVKDHPSATLIPGRRLIPLGRPPLSPLARLDKKLSDLRISPLRRSVDGALSKSLLVRNTSDRDLLSRPSLERPKMLFKQQSEIIDLKMHVSNSPEDENFTSLLSAGNIEKGLSLTGKGSMFLKLSKSDLPSPDTEKSLPMDSVTRSDPPKGILRENLSEVLYKKTQNVVVGKKRQAASFEEDKKSVRFQLETQPDPPVSPSSNSSSEQNDGQSSIISAPAPTVPSPIIPSSPAIPSPAIQSPLVLSSPVVTSSMLNSIVLSPLVSRPPLPPRSLETPKEMKSSGSDKDSGGISESESRDRPSPRRRVLRPPATDYIKPDLFQKNFHKISDLVRPGDIDPEPLLLEEPVFVDKESRPRSPMIPQKNKISINLMESIESETSIDSPDREYAHLDLNDLNDDSNDTPKDKQTNEPSKETQENCEDKKLDENDTVLTDNKIQKNADNISVPQVKVPNLDFLPKSINSDSEDYKNISPQDELSKNSKASLQIASIKSSPTPSLGSELRSPRVDFGKQWSPLSTFKPLNKPVTTSQIKSSDSTSSLGKGATSPRLDGVILSQGKSSTDNIVVVYQFETQEENPKPVKSPLIPDMTRDFLDRNRTDERRRLELSLQRELENMRVEWLGRERKLRADLQEEMREAEERFSTERKVRLSEQAERHQKEMEETLKTSELNHQKKLAAALLAIEEKCRAETESAERQYVDKMAKLRDEYTARLYEQQRQLEMENERTLSEVREQFVTTLSHERTRMLEENRITIESLRDEHTTRITDLRHDYRAEVERLRTQHACHLEEMRARMSAQRLDQRLDQRALADKYKCLKEKYVRLKHDVKMSIERRNKRREMSMTTGSETEKSNSHKANQSLEKCKEVNETSVSAAAEPAGRGRANNNPTIKYNDNETSHSESNAHKSHDNNNEGWKLKRDTTLPSGDTSLTSAKNQRTQRKTAVAFREPPRRRRDRDRDTGATTDCQDSSDATTADEKPKESINGHGRRRCFTRLKSASTSRLNYSPKRGEGWSSPLESLRQQLRKLDDLEDQFPDLACQPAYSLRYPFAELVYAGAVATADTPELEFVRHRALVEREGMRRARAALKRRRAALRETRESLSPHRAPSEEREATELEVALHRARALLGEKEIRLRHIERALRKLTDAHPHPPALVQEATTSDASSGSEATHGEGAAAGVQGGAVLRSLRALHADVRDIWRALDARRPHTASPETSSCNAATVSQPRMTLSAPDPIIPDISDGGIAERARGLRAWLQTAP